MGAVGGSMVVPGGASGQGWTGDAWVVAKEVVVGQKSHRTRSRRTGMGIRQGQSPADRERGLSD